MINNLITCKWL